MASARLASATRSVHAYANTAGRAVHINIYPRPRNLAESRQILHLLQQYGEVISYRHLKHDPQIRVPNTVLAIYQSHASAEKLINASPLRLEVGESGFKELQSNDSAFVDPEASEGWQDEYEEQEGPVEKQAEEPEDPLTTSAGSEGKSAERRDTNPPSTNPQGANRNPSSPTTSHPATSAPTSHNPPAGKIPLRPRPPPPTQPPRSYERHQIHLRITPSIQNHQSYIQRQRYYGSFEVDKTSIMYGDLKDRVPVLGMADCSLDAKMVPLRMRHRAREGRQMSLRELMARREGGGSSRGGRGGEEVQGFTIRKTG